MEPSHHDAATAGKRAVLVSSAFREADTVRHLGREAYSYRFVYRAFAPLLERWGRTSEIDRPASRLDFALRQARRDGLDPIHLSFLPLHLLYPTAQAPNVAFPFWEFPDIPSTDFGTSSSTAPATLSRRPRPPRRVSKTRGRRPTSPGCRSASGCATPTSATCGRGCRTSWTRR